MDRGMLRLEMPLRQERSFFVASSEGICSGLVIIINPPWCSKGVTPDRVHVALSQQPFIKFLAVDADAAPDPDGGQLAGGNERVGLGTADAKQLLDVLQTQPFSLSYRDAQQLLLPCRTFRTP